MAHRRHFVTCIAAFGALSALGLPTRAAQEIALAKILLGASAGGAGDLMARRLSEQSARQQPAVTRSSSRVFTMAKGRVHGAPRPLLPRRPRWARRS